MRSQRSIGRAVHSALVLLVITAFACTGSDDSPIPPMELVDAPVDGVIDGAVNADAATGCAPYEWVLSADWNCIRLGGNPPYVAYFTLREGLPRCWFSNHQRSDDLWLWEAMEGAEPAGPGYLTVDQATKRIVWVPDPKQVEYRTECNQMQTQNADH